VYSLVSHRKLRIPRLILGGNSTYAGASAAMMANVVLVAYVVVAFRSDGYKDEAEKPEEKKTI